MSTNLPINVLAEESTIDPTDPFPSFYEVKLLEGTCLAGEKAIHTTVQAIIDRLLHSLDHGGGSYHHRPPPPPRRPEESLFSCYRQRITHFLYKICSKYQAEIECLVSYTIHRKTLVSPSIASTLSESFYGLKRSKVTSDGQLKPLTKSDGIRAALFLALGPYIQHRLNFIYERRNGSSTHDNITRTAEGKCSKLEKIKQLFVYLYPLLHMSHHGIKLAYQFSYLIGKTRYYDPSLHLLGQIVRRITLEDVTNDPTTRQKTDKTNQRDATIATPNFNRFQQEIMVQFKKAIMIGMTSALVLGWIGKLRLEIQRRRRLWWIQNQHQGGHDVNYHILSIIHDTHHAAATTTQSQKGDATMIPPPPRQPSIPNMTKKTTTTMKKGTVPPNKDFRSCPICHEKRINPAASSSGYVFCFKCLVLHIRRHGPKCPVTGLPCSESQIIRLYEPNKETIVQ